MNSFMGFDSILLPVDFTINTEIAVNKAIDLIGTQGAVIHLVHIMNDMGFKNDRPASRLGALREDMAGALSGAGVEMHLLDKGNVQSAITRLALQLKPQLIIVGKHNYHNWFTFLNTIKPHKLAQQTACPVLTLKKGSLNNKVKSIVFPVTAFVPRRKVELLVMMARKYRARVYLVTLAEEADKPYTTSYYSFIDTYRMLKSDLNCPLEHVVIPGPNLAKSALHFAEQVGADMILVNPESETTISPLSGKQVTDIIKADSKLEVLTVDPYQPW